MATFYLVLAVFGSALSQDQDPRGLIVVFDGLGKKHVPKKQILDSADLDLSCKQIVRQLRKDGYWLASIDQVVYSKDTVIVQCFQGRQFEVISVSLVDEHDALRKLPRFPKIKSNHLTSPGKMESEMEVLLDYLEANGYPFATLTLGSSRIEDDALHVQLRLDIGAKITYDSLTVNPKGFVKPLFLSRYLGLDYGKKYDEQDLAQVEERIQHLPFLSLEKMSTSFQLKKARVSLDVSHRKVNYFDGILGLVPGEDGTGVEVTGELDLNVNNLFQSGKKVEIVWKKLEPGSQQLHASYLHPILLGSPLDFYFALDQIRQDTVYANRSLQVAFDYRPTKNISMRMSYENLLGNELEDQEATSGDFDINYYGLSLTWYQLDQLFNPKKGFKTQLISNIGQKSVRGAGHDIPESTQYRLQAILEGYKQISPRSVFYLASQSGVIFNDYLYLNDLFRLGGLKTIRGFNELEFFASRYTLFNLEWRYYLDANSYIVTFYDQSLLSYEILNGSFEDRPAALGAGMQFVTDRGNFKILYGLGKRGGESFSFSTSKIHFGYTAIF